MCYFEYLWIWYVEWMCFSNEDVYAINKIMIYWCSLLSYDSWLNIRNACWFVKCCLTWFERNMWTVGWSMLWLIHKLSWYVRYFINIDWESYAHSFHGTMLISLGHSVIVNQRLGHWFDIRDCESNFIEFVSNLCMLIHFMVHYSLV